jgi:hypothetical protein
MQVDEAGVEKEPPGQDMHEEFCSPTPPLPAGCWMRQVIISSQFITSEVGGGQAMILAAISSAGSMLIRLCPPNRSCNPMATARVRCSLRTLLARLIAFCMMWRCVRSDLPLRAPNPLQTH